MSREIKFRQWNQDRKEFEYWGFLADEDSSFPYEFTQRPTWDGVPLYTPDEQYTGLKDRNGKDIYEGDILQNQALAKREVRRTKYGEYKLFIGKHSDLFHKGWMPGTVWEVIGSIYQNPELLSTNNKEERT